MLCRDRLLRVRELIVNLDKADEFRVLVHLSLLLLETFVGIEFDCERSKHFWESRFCGLCLLGVVSGRLFPDWNSSVR